MGSDVQTNEGQAEGNVFSGDIVTDDMAASGEAKRRAAGRPVGSVNRRTKEAIDHILARYGDPLLNLAEIGDLTIPGIAKALSCKKLEAARLYRDIMNDLAPYVHSKRPIGVVHKVDDIAPVTLVIPASSGGDNADGRIHVNPMKSIAYDDDIEDVAQESVAQDG